MQNSQDNIVARLFTSFTELETAIASAKKTLAAKTQVPAQVIERLNSYDSILAKQRKLAAELCDLIAHGKRDEISRHVNIINGLSTLITDDARAILSSLTTTDNTVREEEKYHVC